MPGIKKLHQDSKNSSKAKNIYGHMFGTVSALVSNTKKQFALLLSASIKDGVNIIRQYSSSTNEPISSHVVHVIEQAGEIAKKLGKPIVL